MRPSRLGVWPPLPPGAYARRRRRQLPFPLDREDCRLFSRARHGLWAALQALGVERGDEALVPAFHHGSEIETLVQLGLVCKFYGGDGLVPDESELDSLRTPRTRVLYLIHYNGFPQDALRWRRWADERGLLLVEDAAQAWLATSADGDPVGGVGDVSLFCLYKTFGLPDGAAVLARVPPASPGRRPALGAGALVRRHASWLMERSALLASAGAGLRRERPYEPSLDFALGDPATAPTAATRFLLPRIADPGAAVRRHANYVALLGELREAVAAPFASVPEGASPFAFLFETDRREEVVRRFQAHGIGAYPFWLAFHPAAPVDQFPDIAARRRKTVALPVHQELTQSAVRRLVTAARSIELS